MTSLGRLMRARRVRLRREPAAVPGRGMHARGSRRPDRGAGVGRPDPRSHPPGRPGADRPRAQPLPRVGGDVGCVGRLRRDRGRRVRDREADAARCPGTTARTAMSYAAYRDPAVALRHRVGPRRPPPSSSTRRWPACATGPTTRRPTAIARGRSGTASPRRSSSTAAPTAPSRTSATRTRRTRPGNEPLEVAKPGTVMRRPEQVAAARTRRADLPERPAHPGPGPVVHRAAVGPRDLVRPAAVGARDADRPGPPPLLGDAATDGRSRTRRSRSSAAASCSTPPTA